MMKLLIIPFLAIILVTGVFMFKSTAVLANLKYSQATVQIPQNPNASFYDIYYKAQGDKSFSDAVGSIPNVATSYTITYLKKGVNYQYYVTYVDSQGFQHQITPIKWIQDIQSM